MKKRALLSAIALCFIAAGCDAKKAAEPAQPKATAAVTPLPPAAPQPPAASASQDAKPVQLASNDTMQVAQAGTSATAFTPPPRPNPLKGCSDKPGGKGCKVTLTVTGTGDPNCKITADPFWRGVFKAYKNKHIEWNIATADWVFDTDGIDFGSNGQFSGGTGTGTQQYRVKDKNDPGAPTDHNYKINLKHKTTGAKCTKDPTVVNDVQVEE